MKLTQFTALLLLFMVNTLADLLQHEAMLCENDNAPICVRNSHGEYLLFSNECQLQKAKKEQISDGLHEVSLRYCWPNCEFDCGLIYKPICGISTVSNERRTFKNRCELARFSCETGIVWLISKTGTCAVADTKVLSNHNHYIVQSKQHLPLICTKIYNPVCASYAEVKSTFDNECQVNAEIIKTGKVWRIISAGICAEDYNSVHVQQWLAAASSTERSINTGRDVHSTPGSNI